MTKTTTSGKTGEARPVLADRADAPTPVSVIRWQVFALAMPVLGEQFLNAGVGYFDTFLAGRISKEATSAVGFASYVTWLMLTLSWLVGTGATALVARHVGAKDAEGANRFANQSLILGAAFGVVGSIGLFLAAPLFASLQNFTGDAREITVRYLRIDAAGYLLYSVMLAGAASLRGAGDMKTPLWIMVGVNIVNMIVSASLVFGLMMFPKLGTDGIAIGAVVGRTVGGLLMLAVLWRGRGVLRLDKPWLRPRREHLRRLLRVGVPAAIDAAVNWSGHFLFLMIVGRIGEGDMMTANYAAHMVGVRVESFSYLPAMAWGAAAATLVGQGLGAGRADDSRRSGNEAVRQVLVLMCIMGAVYFLFAPALYAVFSNDPRVAALGVRPLRLMSFFQIALGVTIVYIYGLRGAGDTRFPLLCTAIGVWGIRLPIACVCVFGLDMGLIGAWIGMCADISTRAVLMSRRFLRGRWQRIRV